MILRLNGEISRYYVETLCLVFFPGSTFGEGELPGEGIPEVDVSIDEQSNECVTAHVSIKLNDKICKASETVNMNEEISISDHKSIAIGRAMFAAGKEMLGHIPPWGILTGVRPAKIAAGLLMNGKGMIKSKRILRDEYFLNPQKAALAVSVASTEIKVANKMPKDTCSLYVSIPFCPSRCAYCSFVSYTTPRLLSMIDEYLDTLIVDLNDTLNIIDDLGLRVTTVYIGGGTPTTLNEVQLEKLLSHISSRINTSELLEYTLEAGRPDTITEEKLSVAKKYGVSRISVNPQTLNDDILKEIGRNHTTEDFYRAYDIAKISGIKDINVDLIAGLPGDDFDNFSETIDKIIELEPSNITVHTFYVKKASDALKNNKEVYSVSGGDVAKSVSYSQIKTKFAGYRPYYMYRQRNTVGNLENVGFSLEGHESIYNIYMMEEIQTVFAVGAGAVTKIVRCDKPFGNDRDIQRLFRPKYPYEYLREFTDGGQNEALKQRKAEIYKFFDK